MITIIGKHKVQHGDVMNGISELMQDEKAKIFYCDPPWGLGNLRYWQTMNVKNTGAERTPQSHEYFMNAIFITAARYSNNLVFIEYGIRWETFIQELGKNYGLRSLAIVDLRYKSGVKLNPMHLHIFSKKRVAFPFHYIRDLTNTYGLDTLRKAITPFAVPGKIILDPCCGMGYACQVGLETGMIFRGNELNSKRLEHAIQRIRKYETVIS